jgi:hypothetical protein
LTTDHLLGGDSTEGDGGRVLHRRLLVSHRVLRRFRNPTTTVDRPAEEGLAAGRIGGRAAGGSGGLERDERTRKPLGRSSIRGSCRVAPEPRLNGFAFNPQQLHRETPTQCGWDDVDVAVDAAREPVCERQPEPDPFWPARRALPRTPARLLLRRERRTGDDRPEDHFKAIGIGVFSARSGLSSVDGRHGLPLRGRHPLLSRRSIGQPRDSRCPPASR